MVEIVVHQESGRRDLFHGLVLLQDVEVLAGVHLESHVPLARGAHHLGGQVLGRRRTRPGRNGNPVADLLSHEPVGRDFEVFPHEIVERAHETHRKIGVDVVEGMAVRQPFHVPDVHGDVAPALAVSHFPAVRRHLEDRLRINAPELGLLVDVPLRQPGVDVGNRDIGDFHGLSRFVRGNGLTDSPATWAPPPG